MGGASFLVHEDQDGVRHRLGRLRTNYNYTGPNLTDVVYAGVSSDGGIEGRISTQLGRTDDLVRVYYHLSYTFLEDVSYERLALFQMAADNYGDNGFTRYAYGNEAGVVFDEAVPDHGTTGYAGEADRGIPLTGDSPWVMLYDNSRTTDSLPEHLADIAFVVRSYEAVLGVTTTTTPHINIVRTNNGGSQMAFELGVPYDADSPIVPAGSTVTATVEYLVPPADKSRYFGQSDYLTAMPPESYRSTDMILELAGGNRMEVVASQGTVVRTYPVELEVIPGTLAAQFTLTGGLGYTPVTFHGLERHDGWRLEQRVGDDWVRVSQEVEGNDYWQASYDAPSDRYDLVFNVHNRGTNEYRLAR